MLTKRTRFSASANETAVAHATDVLPTPPLPVKSRFRVSSPGKFISSLPRCLGLYQPDRPGASLKTGPGSKETPVKPASCSRVGYSPCETTLPLDQYHRQALCTLRVECLFDRRISAESGKVLREVKALEVNALALQPFQIRRETRQDWIIHWARKHLWNNTSLGHIPEVSTYISKLLTDFYNQCRRQNFGSDPAVVAVEASNSAAVALTAITLYSHTSIHIC